MKRRSIVWLAASSGVISMIADIYWGGALSYYYMRSLGLDIKYHIAVWTAFSVWNAIDDLIAGSIADRSSHKLGRRIPYIRVFAPLMGVFFCLAFMGAPFVRTQLGLAISLFLIISVLDFCMAFLEVCIYTIPYEETLSEAERAKTFMVQTVFAFLSLTVSVLLIPAIQPDVGEDTALFRSVMYGVGLLSAALVFASTYFIDSTYKGDPNLIRSTSIFRYVSDCVRNKPFVICEIYGVASMVVYSMFFVGIYYYLDEVCTNAVPCYIAAILGTAVTLFLYFRYAARLGIRTLVILSAFGCGAALLTGYLMGTRPVGGIFAFFGAGILFVGYCLFYSLMFGDTVDYDESRTGLRREGVYYGFDCLFSSISNASQSVFLAVISAFGYVEHQSAGTQSALAKRGIVTGWLLLPAVLMLLSGVLVALFYPLGRDEVKGIKARILDNRAQAGGGAAHG